MRKRKSATPRWEPAPRTVGLIEWALAGGPENGPLPEGAKEVLMAQRREDLFEAWEGVDKFGPSAAEPLRQIYRIPETLVQQHSPSS